MNQNNQAQDTLVAEKQGKPASEQNATKNMEQTATKNTEQAETKNTDQTAIRNEAGVDRRPEGQPLDKPGEGSAHPPEDAFEAERTRREPVKSGA